MNAKKNKHKKANKQPNPTPPQKEESEKKQEKLECEISEHPDIISNTSAEPEIEVPKKPKRSRGKKKKQDRDDDDKTEVETPELVKALGDEKIENPATTEINIIEAKTKELPIPIEHISRSIEEMDKIAIEGSLLEIVQQTEPFEQDMKHSKKKNKKKKRHDSDKSDRSGDALSCTTAFQKIMDVSDDQSGNRTLEIEDKILIATKDEKKTHVAADSNVLNIVTSETEILTHETHEFKEVQKHEGKKKKNKKDIKHPPKTEDFSIPITSEFVKGPEEESGNKSDFKIIQDQTEIINDEISKTEKSKDFLTENIEVFIDTVKPELITQDLLNPSNDQEIIKKDNTEIVSQDDTGSKLKASIAKPVDKKRKSKQEPTEILLCGNICMPPSDSNILEQPSTIINMPEMPQNEDKITNISEIKDPLEPSDINKISAPKKETNMVSNPVQEMLDPIEQLVNTKEIIHETKEIFSTIDPNLDGQQNTPLDNKFGKKKRKPLKMPIPALVIPEPIKSLEEMSTELIQEGKSEVSDVESIFETLVPANIEAKASEEKLDEILESKIEFHANVPRVSPTKTQQPEEKWTKPKRRGKKSLKMPLTPGARDEQFNLDIGTENVDYVKEPEVTGQRSPTETLEIRSVKADDSECSPCDVTPDIVYPRSTSQLNIDDNNNMVIREISIPDTLNLPIGLTSPLIQGSGETPTGTPIMVSSFNIAEVENLTEKTDLKSKVMEVNQDMEELRLSIERSLAEFTAMEKNEKETENKLKESHVDSIKYPSFEKKNTKQEEIQISSGVSSNLQITPTDGVEMKCLKENENLAPLAMQEDDKDLKIPKDTTEYQAKKEKNDKPPEKTQCAEPPPIYPVRRDIKSKSKKRKGKQEAHQQTTTETSTESSKDKKGEKTEQKSEPKEERKPDTKQKDDDEVPNNRDIKTSDPITDVDYDPIEKFEDALTTSVDDVDVNKSFEMILNEVTDLNQKELSSNKPDINITAPEEDFRESKVPQPKNLLGHPNIPVSSNKDDFKKEKHKNLNMIQAKVKIKDANDIEAKTESKQSQTENRKKAKAFSLKKTNENGDFVYKYSFRKVFLQNTCHVCAKELSSVRVPCIFCNLLFYCSTKHKDEDWPQHQALCFAISTIVHLKDQKHIYAEAKNITGQNYRLLRMQMILSCEKMLKRRLVPWEQEALLYPRICADIRCREWRQSRLKDCEGCGQISYCANSLDHLPLSHQRWCKSYALYQKLVTHQQTKGRLEPKLPTKVMTGHYEIPEKINEVLAYMYEEEIDMNDMQYAALTQIATAPLTVAYSHQLYRKINKPSANGKFKKTSFVIHVLGAELQFEADILNKWEVFFLHLRPDVNELVVVLINSNLNPGNLPLELLGKIRLCENCQQNKRRVIFSFQDKKSYQDFRTSDDFIYPDIVCAFNASINRSSINAKDQWPGIINSMMKLRSPFLITSHTPTELHRDLIRIKECSDVKVMVEPQKNSFASVRPDRNFITDDEAPLLFKNQCFSVLCAV